MTDTKVLSSGSTIDWGMFTQENLEKAFLGWCYRTRHSMGDRRPSGELAADDVDKLTGYPITKAGLLVPGARVPGVEIALKTCHFPDKWAGNCLGRGNDFEGGTLWDLAKKDWTEEEVQWMGELTMRWQRCALSLEKHGWARLKHPSPFRDEAAYVDGRDKTGLPRWWHATFEALDEAEKVIPGTPFAKGPRSRLATSSLETRAHAEKNVPWAYEEYKRESGDGA